MAMISRDLRDLLMKCNPKWGAKAVKNVAKKLLRLNIRDPVHLACYLGFSKQDQKDSPTKFSAAAEPISRINRELHLLGEKGFSKETLSALRKELTSLGIGNWNVHRLFQEEELPKKRRRVQHSHKLPPVVPHMIEECVPDLPVLDPKFLPGKHEFADRTYPPSESIIDYNYNKMIQDEIMHEGVVVGGFNAEGDPLDSKGRPIKKLSRHSKKGTQTRLAKQPSGHIEYRSGLSLYGLTGADAVAGMPFSEKEKLFSEEYREEQEQELDRTKRNAVGFFDDNLANNLELDVGQVIHETTPGTLISQVSFIEDDHELSRSLFSLGVSKSMTAPAGAWKSPTSGGAEVTGMESLGSMNGMGAKEPLKNIEGQRHFYTHSVYSIKPDGSPLSPGRYVEGYQNPALKEHEEYVAARSRSPFNKRAGSPLGFAKMLNPDGNGFLSPTGRSPRSRSPTVRDRERLMAKAGVRPSAIRRDARGAGDLVKSDNVQDALNVYEKTLRERPQREPFGDLANMIGTGKANNNRTRNRGLTRREQRELIEENLKVKKRRPLIEELPKAPIISPIDTAMDGREEILRKVREGVQSLDQLLIRAREPLILRKGPDYILNRKRLDKEKEIQRNARDLKRAEAELRVQQEMDRKETEPQVLYSLKEDPLENFDSPSPKSGGFGDFYGQYEGGTIKLSNLGSSIKVITSRNIESMRGDGSRVDSIESANQCRRTGDPLIDHVLEKAEANAAKFAKGKRKKDDVRVGSPTRMPEVMLRTVEGIKRERSRSRSPDTKQLTTAEKVAALQKERDELTKYQQKVLEEQEAYAISRGKTPGSRGTSRESGPHCKGNREASKSRGDSKGSGECSRTRSNQSAKGSLGKGTFEKGLDRERKAITSVDDSRLAGEKAGGTSEEQRISDIELATDVLRHSIESAALFMGGSAASSNVSLNVSKSSLLSRSKDGPKEESAKDIEERAVVTPGLSSAASIVPPSVPEDSAIENHSQNDGVNNDGFYKGVRGDGDGLPETSIPDTVSAEEHDQFDADAIKCPHFGDGERTSAHIIPQEQSVVTEGLSITVKPPRENFRQKDKQGDKKGDAKSGFSHSQPSESPISGGSEAPSKSPQLDRPLPKSMINRQDPSQKAKYTPKKQNFGVSSPGKDARQGVFITKTGVTSVRGASMSPLGVPMGPGAASPAESPVADKKKVDPQGQKKDPYRDSVSQKPHPHGHKTQPQWEKPKAVEKHVVDKKKSAVEKSPASPKSDKTPKSSVSPKSEKTAKGPWPHPREMLADFRAQGRTSPSGRSPSSLSGKSLTGSSHHGHVQSSAGSSHGKSQKAAVAAERVPILIDGAAPGAIPEDEELYDDDFDEEGEEYDEEYDDDFEEDDTQTGERKARTPGSGRTPGTGRRERPKSSKSGSSSRPVSNRYPGAACNEHVPDRSALDDDGNLPKPVLSTMSRSEKMREEGKMQIRTQITEEWTGDGQKKIAYKDIPFSPSGISKKQVQQIMGRRRSEVQKDARQRFGTYMNASPTGAKKMPRHNLSPFKSRDAPNHSRSPKIPLSVSYEEYNAYFEKRRETAATKSSFFRTNNEPPAFSISPMAANSPMGGKKGVRSSIVSNKVHSPVHGNKPPSAMGSINPPSASNKSPVTSQKSPIGGNTGQNDRAGLNSTARAAAVDNGGDELGRTMADVNIVLEYDKNLTTSDRLNHTHDPILDTTQNLSTTIGHTQSVQMYTSSYSSSYQGNQMGEQQEQHQTHNGGAGNLGKQNSGSNIQHYQPHSGNYGNVVRPEDYGLPPDRPKDTPTGKASSQSIAKAYGVKVKGSKRTNSAGSRRAQGGPASKHRSGNASLKGNSAAGMASGKPGPTRKPRDFDVASRFDDIATIDLGSDRPFGNTPHYRDGDHNLSYNGDTYRDRRGRDAQSFRGGGFRDGFRTSDKGSDYGQSFRGSDFGSANSDWDGGLPTVSEHYTKRGKKKQEKGPISKAQKYKHWMESYLT